ncbi:hypothetical protein Sjap_006839 [Stephania japonica]|uniref:thiamine diphosphokinase n=1 Tax=Stephania japonica TaxID=461633 RepID=A0AAP0PN70_9MAGN
MFPVRKLTMELMSHCSSFLLPSIPPETRPSLTYALVVLNQRLPRFTPLLWKHAQLRLCADGGANRVFDEMPQLMPNEDALDVQKRFRPDVIKGDMDSIRPEVLGFYSNLGTKIVDESHDQETTDLHKCVAYIRDFASNLDNSNVCILVAGALGGRFDHEIGNINVLCRFSDIRIILLSDDCLIQLLPKSHRHEIHILPSVEGPHCGLIPIMTPSAISTTTGLKWNLEDTRQQHSPMPHRSLSLNLMFFALSITLASPPILASRKSVASDLIALLGSRAEASRINKSEAKALRSCFKFLVHPPLAPNSIELGSGRREMVQRFDWRWTLESVDGEDRTAVEDELVWWPPEPVMELARIAVDSGGDPAEIHRALDPTVLIVPDIEGSRECHCELTTTPYGRCFVSEDLNYYVAFLFELIASRGPSIGLNITLNRFDLFHGHVFLSSGNGRLGILFHAREYPAYDKNVFPYNMGYCQKGSCVACDGSMNLRNILWLAPLPSNFSKGWTAPGVLVALDAHPGGIIFKDLVPDYVDDARTIYEADVFGDVVFDVNYLNVGDEVAEYRLFIC